MLRLIAVNLFIAFSCWGVPTCQISANQTTNKLSTVSGTSSGFQNGKVYVSISNGNRTYTTIAEKNGHWALSFANLDKKSEIVCWQEGNGLQAKQYLTQP